MRLSNINNRVKERYDVKGEETFNTAARLFEAGNYAEAEELQKAIDNVRFSYYDTAPSFVSSEGNFEKTSMIYKCLGDYKDAPQLAPTMRLHMKRSMVTLKKWSLSMARLEISVMPLNVKDSAAHIWKLSNFRERVMRVVTKGARPEEAMILLSMTGKNTP